MTSPGSNRAHRGTASSRSPARRVTAVLLAAAALGSVAYLWWGAGEYATLERLNFAARYLATLAANRPVVIAAALFLFYFVASCCSIPGTVLSSVLAGSILGLWPGLAIASIALTLGSTVAFIAARYLAGGWAGRLVGDWARSNLANRVKLSPRPGELRWLLYVLSLRLNPAIPYFLVNWAMAVTPIRVTWFAIASQIGMLPALMIYVNAGAHLSKVHGLQGLLSADAMAALLLLSCLPLISRAAR